MYFEFFVFSMFTSAEEGRDRTFRVISRFEFCGSLSLFAGAFGVSSSAMRSAKFSVCVAVLVVRFVR